MAKKIAVAQVTSGDMPETGLDVLNRDGDSIEVTVDNELIEIAISPQYQWNGVAVSLNGRMFASFPRWLG